MNGKELVLSVSQLQTGEPLVFLNKLLFSPGDSVWKACMLQNGNI